MAFALPPFTTTPKTALGSGGQVAAVHVATGCHGSFDRSCSAPASRDAALRRPLRQEDRGRRGLRAPVRLLGTKRIKVLIRDARGHTEGGSNLLPNVRTPLAPNLRQIKNAGDFEDIVTFGLGLRRKTGFRVFRLTGPTRLVIDVSRTDGARRRR